MSKPTPTFRIDKRAVVGSMLASHWRLYVGYVNRAVRAEEQGRPATAKYYQAAAAQELNRHFDMLERNLDLLSQP